VAIKHRVQRGVLNSDQNSIGNKGLTEWLFGKNTYTGLLKFSFVVQHDKPKVIRASRFGEGYTNHTTYKCTNKG